MGCAEWHPSTHSHLVCCTLQETRWRWCDRRQRRGATRRDIPKGGEHVGDRAASAPDVITDACY